MKNIAVFFLLTVLVSFNQCRNNHDSLVSSDSSNKGKGGSLSRFAILGNYLYTVDSRNLTVYELNSTTGEPAFKKKLEVGPEIETIFPFKDKLFIGSTSLLYIYSLKNPADPKAEGKAGSSVVSYRCDPVVVKENVAFATLRANSTGCSSWVQRSVLAVYDVTDVANPKEKTTLNLEEPYGLGYADTTLYVCQRKGLTIFGIASPLKPKEIKTIDKENWYKDVITYNDELLICWTDKALKLYRISKQNQANPELIATIL